MWVKICANTNLEDAAMAAELGADAVGFIFAPSKRQVTVAQVAAITPHLPSGVERVGVFATDDVEEIARSVREAGLTAVQMHGGFNLELAGRLAARTGPDISIIETIHWNVGDGPWSRDIIIQQLSDAVVSPVAYRVLMDSKIGGVSGGTGVSFDWSEARTILDTQPVLRIIVAGGLCPGNVSEAIRNLRPWGVDVASGVESSPGRKDAARVAAFIANARRADTTLSRPA